MWRWRPLLRSTSGLGWRPMADATARLDELRNEAEAAVAPTDDPAAARGAAGPLPRPQVRADRRPARYPRAAGGAARAGRPGGEPGPRGTRVADRRARVRAPERRPGATAGRGPDRRDAARRPAAAARLPAPGHPDPARHRGHLPGHGLLGRRGPRGRVRLLQLHRAQHPARPPGADHGGHVLLLRRRRPAHAHVADAGPRRWRSRSRRSTSSCPARPTGATTTRRTRRCSTRWRAWRSTRTSRSAT